MKRYRFEIYYWFSGDNEVKGALVEATNLLMAIRLVPEYAAKGYLGRLNWICPEYEKDMKEHMEAGDYAKWEELQDDKEEGEFLRYFKPVQTSQGFKERWKSGNEQNQMYAK